MLLLARSQMLFFDDMEKNCRDVAQLGVTTMHCPGGLTQDVSYDLYYWQYAELFCLCYMCVVQCGCRSTHSVLSCCTLHRATVAFTSDSWC
jgi:Acid Phosphatase